MESKFELVPINEIKDMAAQVCKSGLFGLPTPEAAFTLMMICQSEGIHPIQAVKRFHIIKGKPSMRADAMLAEFQRLGGRVKWIKRTDSEVVALFSHPQGEAEITWTIEMAKAAGLTINDTWRKYPRQMLTARTVSEGIRTVLPAVVTGIYTPEEISDFADEPKAAHTRKPKEAVSEAPTSEPIAPKSEAPAPTLYEKIKNQTPEMVPEDAVAVDMPQPEIKAAERPPVYTEVGQPGSRESVVAAEINRARATISAGEMAAEIKQARTLAQKYGCKSQNDFAELMQSIIGKPYGSASQLTNDDERAAVIAFLLDATREEQKEAA